MSATFLFLLPVMSLCTLVVLVWFMVWAVIRKMHRENERSINELREFIKEELEK